MSKIILGHPYSGALYAYIADQMQGASSHTKAVGRHSYFTTLYGRNYAEYTERALMFTLVYDEVYLTPADNPWPKSTLSSSNSVHVELGLHADWDDYKPLFNDTGGHIHRYLGDPVISAQIRLNLNIPLPAQKMVMSSILYEYNLSRELRCPVICSPGRRQILQRLVEIDKPAIHATTMGDAHIAATDAYLDATGLLLSPTSLDNLIEIKPNRNVRAYGGDLLSALTELQSNPTSDFKVKLLTLARNAIETETVGKHASGLLGWLGTLLRIVGLPHLATISTVGAKLIDYQADQASWYAFSGEVRKAETKAVLVREIDTKLDKLKSGAS